MSCHCSVEVSTGCTGAAGPFLLGGLYTGRLYSRVATLVCLDFAFVVFSVVVLLLLLFGFFCRHSPTSASGIQASQFVCRCNVIPEVQWVVPVPGSFFTWKSLLSNTRVVNLFFCLFLFLVKNLTCQIEIICFCVR